MITKQGIKQQGMLFFEMRPIKTLFLKIHVKTVVASSYQSVGASMNNNRSFGQTDCLVLSVIIYFSFFEQIKRNEESKRIRTPLRVS